jgi:hypothetical protein
MLGKQIRIIGQQSFYSELSRLICEVFFELNEDQKAEELDLYNDILKQQVQTVILNAQSGASSVEEVKIGLKLGKTSPILFKKITDADVIALNRFLSYVEFFEEPSKCVVLKEIILFEALAECGLINAPMSEFNSVHEIVNYRKTYKLIIQLIEILSIS